MQPFNFPPLDFDATPLGPLLAVALTGIIALVWQMLRSEKDNTPSAVISVLGLLVAGVMVAMQFDPTSPPLTAMGGMLVVDSFGLSMQLLMIVAAIVSILFSEGYMQEKRIPFGEFYPMVVWSTLGGMVMAATNNLLMIFLGLEVLSISLYVMAGMSRTEERSQESAMKYFLLGSFSSGFLLYGIAFFYGGTGNLHLDAVGAAFLHGDQAVRTMLLFGLGLMLIGLCFKSSLVPFHQWTPDVYQGAPTNVTTFMATGSKVAAFAAMWRVLDGAYVMRDFWIPALSVVAALTMTVGNLIALTQKDVKRVLGYSSIAHAGYILVGILAYFKDRDAAQMGTTVFYLLSYLLMTAGAFAVVSLTASKGSEGTQYSDLHGLYKRSPIAAAGLVLFVASLIGIPPLAGFFGKLAIFRDALGSGLTWLAILLAVNSVISVYYYLGIARAAFVADEDGETVVSARPSFGLALTTLLCAVGVFVVSGLIQPIVTNLHR
jgi:NADH-quinone oxidoreductase subunit N